MNLSDWNCTLTMKRVMEMLLICLISLHTLTNLDWYYRNLVTSSRFCGSFEEFHSPDCNTVAIEKSIYQEYMERTLFHSELWGIFPIKFFPEADNKISTSPEIVHVNFPINIGKISMEQLDFLGFDLTTFRLPLAALLHSAMTPLGYTIKKIYVYI
jgi:hypothetical protein